MRLFVQVLLVFSYFSGFIQYLLVSFDFMGAVFVSVLYVLGFQGVLCYFYLFPGERGGNEHRKWKQINYSTFSTRLLNKVCS